MTYCEECEKWKDASGLMVGGDPDMVSPDMLRSYLVRLTGAVERYLSECGACEDSEGMESLCCNKGCAYCELERALDGVKGCAE